MDGLIKGMPFDEITQAMIPTYQQHFTKGRHRGHECVLLFARGAKRSATAPRGHARRVKGSHADRE
jgi:hypothetical protein